MNNINTPDSKLIDQKAAEVLADLLSLSKAILEINIERLNSPTNWSRIAEANHTRAILKEAHEFLTR